MSFKRFLLRTSVGPPVPFESSGSLAAPLFNGAEPNVNFGSVHHKQQFCEIILNLDQWFRGRCHIKTFLT